MKEVMRIKLEDLGEVQKLIKKVYENKAFVIDNDKYEQFIEDSKNNKTAKDSLKRIKDRIEKSK